MGCYKTRWTCQYYDVPPVGNKTFEVTVRQYEPGGEVVREQTIALEGDCLTNAGVSALAWAYGRWGKELWLDTIIKEVSE